MVSFPMSGPGDPPSRDRWTVTLAACLGLSAGPRSHLQVRATLDYAGGHDVRVIPCKEDMLYERMGVIIGLPEPDWASARPEGWTRGGSWGSQRTILFSGMKCALPSATTLTTQPASQDGSCVWKVVLMTWRPQGCTLKPLETFIRVSDLARMQAGGAGGAGGAA